MFNFVIKGTNTMFLMNKKLLTLFVLLLVVLSACSSSNEPPDPGQVLTQAAQLASAGSTMTAEAMPPTMTLLPPTATHTLEPVPSATQNIVPTNALSEPTIDPNATNVTPVSSPPPISTQPPATSTPLSNISSDCFVAGFTYDGPPADYTHFHGTVSFVKEWRLQNIGTCSWASDVYLVWFATTIIENGVEVRDSGETFGQNTEIAVITEPIPPGGYLNLAVEFTAPPTGNETYKVYYKLYGPAGFIDIGGGSIWFIVDVTPP